MINFIKRIIRKTTIFLYHRLKNVILPIKSKKLLIVRFDAIGDYVLFRNFIYILKESEKFKNYSFHFLGNIIYKDLAEYFEKSIIDKFYFVNLNEIGDICYNSNKYNRLKFILKYKSKRFDILINPVHSRALSYDLLLKELGAKQMIGSIGDTIRFTSIEQYNFSKTLYSKTVTTLDESNFEFYRNIVFCQNLLETKIDIKLNFDIPKKISTQTVIINPGAGFNSRRWGTDKFACLIDIITSQYNNKFKFIIIGTKNERELASEIIQNVKISNNIIDCTGKTGLVEVVNLINDACMLISNETSTVHIAAAVHTSTICISNGNHFGRFNPYPKDICDCISTIYPMNEFYENSEKERLMEMTRDESDLDINIITVNQVVDVFNSILESQPNDIDI